VSDAVEISFGADLSDLETGAADAVALLHSAADEMADAFAPRGDSRQADEARRIADEKIRIDEQASLKSIAIEEDANNFLYAMGEESLDRWKAQALEEENAKYVAELAWLAKKTAADRGDAAAEAKDLAERAALYQDHVLALQKLDEQYAERKRALDRQELQDFIAADNAKLSAGIRALDAEYKQHQLTAGQRYTLEQQLTQDIHGEELKRVDALLATLTQGTKAYEDAIRQRQKIEQDFTRQSEANTNQLETEEAAKWTQLGNSIKSSFNSALDGMLFQGKSFEQGMLAIAEGVLKAFLTMGENIAENWIQTQLESLFETKATQTSSALGQISDAAAVAGANTFASTAAIPVIGPELAPGAAAASIAQVMSYSSLLSLDVGAWEMKNDSIARLHKGEMVVPENFASGLRGNGGGLGGDNYHFHTDYHPSWSGRDPVTPQEFFRKNHNEIIGELKRLARNGSLSF